LRLPHASEKAVLRPPNVASLINPNFAVEFKESDKRMMQNTEKPLLRKQEALSEKKHKKMRK